MQSIYGCNFHQAFPKAMSMIRLEGYTKGHRASVGPVSIEVANPAERLSYGTPYDLNPFIALFTALWSLDGRNDVQFLTKFDGYSQGSSDDGQVIPGAYGMRMRDHFRIAPNVETGLSLGRIDQLKSVVMMLQNNPDTCTPVISLWDTGTDLGLNSPNTPRATHIYLSIGPDNRLNMLMIYRSADILDLRLDSIVFSMIHEYIASATQISLGRMTFVINSLDCDTEILALPYGIPPNNPYKSDVVDSPLVSMDPEAWLGELSIFLDEGPVMGMRDSFFRHVASPMWQAWAVYRNTSGSLIGAQGAHKALGIVTRIRAADWRAAATEWLVRKIDDQT